MPIRHDVSVNYYDNKNRTASAFFVVVLFCSSRVARRVRVTPARVIFSNRKTQFNTDLRRGRVNQILFGREPIRATVDKLSVDIRARSTGIRGGRKNHRNTVFTASFVRVCSCKKPSAAVPTEQQSHVSRSARGQNEHETRVDNIYILFVRVNIYISFRSRPPKRILPVLLFSSTPRGVIYIRV